MPGGQGFGQKGSEFARPVTNHQRETLRGLSTIQAAAAVYGSSQDSHGVTGYSRASDGVNGESNSGDGVRGSSNSGDGVSGFSDSGEGGGFYSMEGYGIRAGSGVGKAAKFNGDVEVTGEVYAKSVHTTNETGETTSGVTTNGDASYTSVTTSSFQTTNDAGETTSSIDVNGNASFMSVGTVRLTIPEGWASIHTGTFNSVTTSSFQTTNDVGETTSSIDANGNSTFEDLAADGGTFNSVTTSRFQTTNDAGETTSSIDANGNSTFADLAADGGTFNSVSVPTANNGFNGLYSNGMWLYESPGNTTGRWNSETGNLSTTGNFSAHGTKTAVVSTASYGQRKLYADESAEVSFFDRGHGQLINGAVTIELDPLFLETVTINEDYPMIAQITLTGDCRGVFVSNQTSTSFTVKELMGGASNATFNWEVCAKRKGYESVRLEPFESPYPMGRR